jgi:glutathione peroxidase
MIADRRRFLAMLAGGVATPAFAETSPMNRPLDAPRWNFHKYLIGRSGHIAAVFPTAVEPSDPRVAAAIETELAATG